MDWEFPGGQVPGLSWEPRNTERNLRLVKHEATRETKEETGIKLPEQPIITDSFDYSFKGKGDNRVNSRIVFMTYSKIDTPPEVILNTIPKDNHAVHKLVTKEELNEMRRKGKLSGNSTHFDATIKFAPR